MLRMLSSLLPAQVKLPILICYLRPSLQPICLISFESVTQGPHVRNLMLRVVVLSSEGACKSKGLLGIRLWGHHEGGD